MRQVIEQVRRAAMPVLDSLGFELVEVQFSGGGRGGILRLFIDKPGGVTLADCEQASMMVGHALDVEDPIPQAYVLEVSSPGLDRPLKRPEEYQRYRDRLVKIHTGLPVDGQNVIVGRLGAVEGERVEIRLDSGRTVSLPFSEIRQARLQVEWGTEKQP
jgi:ribosome maturation factor RimP